jgi:CheY-like chemotaxis protein
MAKKNPWSRLDEYPIALLLEADPGFAVQLRLALQSQYRVAVAADLDQLIELAQRSRPDIVFIDTTGTGLRAAATVLRLRAQPATRAIPLVFLSERTPPVRPDGLDADLLVVAASREGLLRLGAESGRRRSPAQADSAPG